jgi:hypothetical protein
MKLKKCIYSPLLVIGALSLSACAMFGGDSSNTNDAHKNNNSGHADMSANQQAGDKTTVSVQQQNNTGSSPSDNQPSKASNSNGPTSTIDLESKDNRVYAHVTTNWGDAKEGSLSIKWIPPQGSNCQESSFVITKYSDTNDDTWAYRTYNSSVHQCAGVWQAQVISDNGNTLSSAEIDAK